LSTAETILVQGAGADAAPAKADNFFFVSRTVTNSVEFTARLVKSTNWSALSRCGLMIRESVHPGAPFVFIGVSSNNLFAIQRSITNGQPTWTNTPVISQVVDLRLTRTNDTFLAAASVDRAATWKTISSNRIVIRTNGYLIGLGVSSGSPTRTVAAEFHNVSVESLSNGQ
jgi:hypothetical protein